MYLELSIGKMYFTYTVFEKANLLLSFKHVLCMILTLNSHAHNEDEDGGGGGGDDDDNDTGRHEPVPLDNAASSITS
jgi:hypothetical protein